MNPVYNTRLKTCSIGLTLLCLASAPSAMAEMDHSQHLMQASLQHKTIKRHTHRYQLPDTQLLQADGSRTSLQQALNDDKPIMLNFIYTTCTAVCPIMSGSFAEVQKQLHEEAKRGDFRMLSISIDPEYDTPEKLAAYAQKYRSAENWDFFSGQLADIVELQKAFDSYRGNKMNHVPITFMRAHADAPWVRLEGFASAKDIVKEYKMMHAMNH